VPSVAELLTKTFMPLFGAPHSSFLYCQADNRGIGRLVLVYCNLASKVNHFLRLLFPNQWQRFSYRIQRAGPKQSAKKDESNSEIENVDSHTEGIQSVLSNSQL
jgi:hypothetical protein